MKKYIVCLIFVLLLGIFLPGKVWAKTAEDTSPFEYEIVDEGENTCRITEIRITKDEGISKLEIPDTINGKTVVSIGPGLLTGNNEDPLMQNVFGLYEWVVGDESYKNWDCKSKEQKNRAMKIEEVVLPDTITYIKEYCFATLKKLKTVRLSKALTSVGRYAFMATPRLQKINIPANVKDGLTRMKEAGFSWKHFTISNEHPYYKVIKGLLLSKDGKTVYATVSSKKNIRIPDSIQTIAESAFYNVSLKSVYLGSGIREIQAHGLATSTKCKITISKKNRYLARSGMCIYHKKKRNLLVGIPKTVKIKKKKRYILKIPKKVKQLGKTISIVGNKRIKKIYFPKGMKKEAWVTWNSWRAREEIGLEIDEWSKFIKY